MQYVVEIMTHDGITCKVDEYHKACKLKRDIKNNNCGVDVEIYKLADYAKLHPDFVSDYHTLLRSQLVD